jgi:hypothetical protein
MCRSLAMVQARHRHLLICDGKDALFRMVCTGVVQADQIEGENKKTRGERGGEWGGGGHVWQREFYSDPLSVAVLPETIVWIGLADRLWWMALDLDALVV